MRLCKSLISSFAQPFNGFCEIFFYSIAFAIANPKVILGFCISLPGGF